MALGRCIGRFLGHRGVVARCALAPLSATSTATAPAASTALAIVAWTVCRIRDVMRLEARRLGVGRLFRAACVGRSRGPILLRPVLVATSAFAFGVAGFVSRLAIVATLGTLAPRLAAL